jgi:hypothetical protein
LNAWTNKPPNLKWKTLHIVAIYCMKCMHCWTYILGNWVLYFDYFNGRNYSSWLANTAWSGCIAEHILGSWVLLFGWFQWKKLY